RGKFRMGFQAAVSTLLHKHLSVIFGSVPNSDSNASTVFGLFHCRYYRSNISPRIIFRPCSLRAMGLFGLRPQRGLQVGAGVSSSSIQNSRDKSSLHSSKIMRALCGQAYGGRLLAGCARFGRTASIAKARMAYSVTGCSVY